MPILDLPVSLYLANPAAPTVTPQGSTGAATYGYKIVAIGVNADGSASHSAAGTEGTTSTGNATLDTTNFNRITWTRIPGNSGYKVYRTTGGTSPPKFLAAVAQNVETYDDKGAAGTAATPESANTSGIGTSVGVMHLMPEKSYQIGGTFVATVNLEQTVNGSDWQPIFQSGPWTTGTIVTDSTRPQFVRAKLTAYTSGTPTVKVGAYGARYTP